MELRQLETFVRVVTLQNFTRAADDLSLTQPAVTRQIAALEQELKTRLFERLGRRVLMTGAGEVLYGYATEIVRLAEEAKRAVADVAEGITGRLSVGASSTAATYLLPPLLRTYRETYPGVDLSVHTGQSSRITEMVIGNSVDVGIVMDFQEQKGIQATVVAEYSSVVVVYPEHPLANGNSVTVSALADSSLIAMQSGTTSRIYVDQLFSEANVPSHVSMELDNVEAIKKMIESRLGISILPDISVAAEIAVGRLIALPLAGVPKARQRIAAIHREDKYVSAALKAFILLLAQEFIPLRQAIPGSLQEAPGWNEVTGGL